MVARAFSVRGAKWVVKEMRFGFEYRDENEKEEVGFLGRGRLEVPPDINLSHCIF